jgi:hypothetical protein
VTAGKTHLFFICQVKFGHDVPLDRGNLQTSISETQIEKKYGINSAEKMHLAQLRKTQLLSSIISVLGLPKTGLQNWQMITVGQVLKMMS